ncbi:hypothetical protein [Conexibacter sp. CPCC 206217]|uniref:hypothetical protein n=1 Tax=Conexibacter sp. CPCC 206217 TaxID=3064574 RepID=UPI00271A2107|nr:hypothetical protein [Conexibacter sp. CPCC 206217]MDO8213984.1 hypothetical protein [Conexibacter sp. CPCC 206217]
MSTTLPGARESSAGDEFHVLWAVRRVLAFLDAASGLQRIVMEDVTPVPPDGVDPELLLGADLTEFYGGTELASASRVVISQLKYSHRHPDRSWTAARLAAKNSRGKKGVIARLADLSLAVSGTGTRDEVLARLEIRLVSNMPCADGLSDAMADAREWLDAHPARAARAALLRALSEPARRQIQQLSDASGLSSFAFTDFLRVLNLDHTGSESRAEQSLRVTTALADHVMADLRHASLKLADLVRHRGLPEGEGLPIERADVLAALDVASEEDLLPCPARFTPPAHRVMTPDAARIAAKLLAAEDRRVLAHGAAGVGKTTTVLALEHALPSGSVVITYDCFGDGDYDTPAAARHSPLRFALQLCNEIAARCGLPVLVQPSTSVHDLWRELERRLEAAARLLGEQGAQLVVVVDAADNSAAAAQLFNEDCFLRRLWAQPIPAGAGLIVTCRTGRRNVVEAPPSVTQVTMNGFDERASGQYLRERFPSATDDEARAFHENSRGNPRIQFYALFENRADSATSTSQAIAQADLTPSTLFENLLAAAVSHAPDEAAARDHMAELVCLTKPLTTSRFQAVSGMAATRVHAFCENLVPGVLIDGGVISFRDEDFANFLRDRVGEDDAARAHGRLADLFLSQPDDAYAATVVADHLHNAGRGADLVALALSGSPSAVADGLARQQTYRRRLTLAMRHAANVADRAAACRLVVLAGEAARQNGAVTEILRRRPDLGMRYSDPEAVMRVYSTAAQPEWRGPIHMRLAGLYASMGDLERAREEGRAAQAWLLRRHEEDDVWPIEADDVGAFAEAWFHVRGPEEAARYLSSWRPTDFAVDAAISLVRRLARTVPGDELGAFITKQELPADVLGRLTAAAFNAGAVPRASTVRTIVRKLVEDQPSIGSDDGWWVAACAELAAYVGVGRRRILALVKALRLPQPTSAPGSFDRLDWYRAPLRVAALRAAIQGRELQLEELMPKSVTEPGDDRRGSSRVDSERRQMHENVGRYLRVYASRARALLLRPPVSELRAEWEDQLQRELREQAAYRREHDYDHTIWVAAFTDALLACDGTDIELLRLASDAGERRAGRSAFACWLAAARPLLNDARYQREALKLVERAAVAIEAEEWPASQQADSLLDACSMVDPVDAEHARDLHARAIRAAEGLDDEAVGRLELHARVAANVTGIPDAAPLAWRTAQALVAYRNRVSDDERLPWRKTLAAIAILHPQTALALVARFEDDCHMGLHESVPVVAGPLARTGFLTPVQAMSLLLLAGEAIGAIDVATELLDLLPPGPDFTSALAALSLRIRRDLLPGTRSSAAQTLLDWAEGRGVSSMATISALHAYISPTEEEEHTPAHTREWQGGETDWDRRARQADEIVERARVGNPAVVESDLRELANLFGSSRVSEYLARVADSVVPSRRSELIDTLGSIRADHPIANFHAVDVFEALCAAAQEWTGSQDLQSHVSAAIARFFETHFGELTRYPEVAEKALGKLLRLALLDDPAGSVLRAASSKLEHLDASALFVTASQLALVLKTGEQASLLAWSLEAFEPEPVKVPEISEERAEVLSGLLCSLFGAPDKVTRWRAAHAARSLMVESAEPMGRALLNRCMTHDSGAFGSDALPFLWLSAQVWALMVISRVARDAPESVMELAPELARIATDTSWPHAGLREFARRAALRLVAASPDALRRDAIEDLLVANSPRGCRTLRENHFYRTGSGNREYDRERFHFNSMDTIPYVYGPLGERFGLNVDEVCDRAEHWIVDRLGLADFRESDRRLAHVEYHDRNNRHGASPRAESWHQMLEDHALQLVAGGLCDEGAVIEAESGGEPRDPWADWIGSWTDSAEYGWLVDEREPVPPSPALLLHNLRRGEWPELTETDLETAIGAFDQESLIVDAAIELFANVGWGSTYVSSAIVSPETAPALARALSSPEDPREFGLPQGSGRSGYQDDIDSDGFWLQGWIDEEHHDAGLEKHDPLRRIEPVVVHPGDRFMEVCRGHAERGGRRVLGNDGALIAWQRSWSDIDSAYERDSRGTEGRQVFVRRKALCDFLRATGSFLVIRAWAVRRKTASEDRAEEKAIHERTIHRVYIFDPDSGFLA